PEDEKIGLLVGNQRAQAGRLLAFACDEAELLQRLAKEVAYVRLAVGDAYARCNLAPPECGAGGFFFEPIVRFHGIFPLQMKRHSSGAMGLHQSIPENAQPNVGLILIAIIRIKTRGGRLKLSPAGYEKILRRAGQADTQVTVFQ
ncbi:MAG: hypothetical protein ACRECA_12540, partial [Pseudolabrys sp.]